MGVNNILALRGDERDDLEKGDFEHAVDLISYIKGKYGDKVNIIAACYPEGHIEAHNIVDDVKHLKEKVDAGASQLITQLFFNNDSFYRFKERCDLVGIKVPILAGIVPVANKKQIERIVTLCGVELPAKFTKIMSKYEDNLEALRDAGIAYAIDQIVDLITQGIDGIHLHRALFCLTSTGQTFCFSYFDLAIAVKNSSLVFVIFSLSIKNSVASISPIGCKNLRKIHIF